MVLHIGSRQAYEEMAQKHDKGLGGQIQFYSSAFSELQVDFVKHQCTSVKRLIKLLKYWQKVNIITRKRFPEKKLVAFTNNAVFIVDFYIYMTKPVWP